MTGDGQADLCGRGVAGLLCIYSMDGRFSYPGYPDAPSGFSSFPELDLVSPDFSDAAGFGITERGTTIQLADIDGDGRADACASGSTTLRCTRIVPEPHTTLGLFVGALALAGLQRRRARSTGGASAQPR